MTAWLLSRAKWRAWHVVAIGCVAAAVFVVIVPAMYRAVPVAPPDSASYLQWMVGRTAGYPLLLRAIRWLSPSLVLLGPVQFVILAAGACWFTDRLERFSGSRALAAACGLAIVLHPQIVSYTQTVLPEAVFLSVLLLLLASVMDAIRAPAVGSSLAAGLLAGLLILIKPVAYAFVPAVILAMLVMPAAIWFRATLATVSAVVSMLMLGALLTFARAGVFTTQSFTGYALIGLTGGFVSPEDVPEHSGLVTAITQELTAVRKALERTPTLELYHFLSAISYHVIATVWVKAIEDHLQRHEGLAPGTDASFVRLNEISMEISQAAIRRHTREYVRYVAAQLYALWMVPFVRSPGQAQNLGRAIDTLAAETPGGWPERPVIRTVPAPAALALRAMLALALLISIVSVLPLRLLQSSTAWQMVRVTSVLTHGYFVLVALLQPGLPRYALMMWPAMILLVSLPFSGLARRAATS